MKRKSLSRSKMENHLAKVWLVTGSASGLGRNIAEAVLASGDRLVATARDPRRLEDLVKKYGNQIRTAPLDVADEKAAQASVQVAVDAFGRLDVVVNNAGYGDIAPFEQLSSERFKALMDTNFYGVVNVTRAALSTMRKQKSGCILQISSVGGRLARPGSAGYHAAKWAVGGFTESIAQEVAPFGVKVCALEPGGMRTNWGVRANKETPILLPEYEPSVGAVVKALESYWGNEISDPAKVAQLILRLAASDQLPAHLLIGSDAVQFAGQAEATRASEAERWREVSVSTDVNAAGPLPAVKF
jgi:NAD(P)-dependent dehydrogenase (short-subunit alcohol dehydrogenase family)